MRCGGIPACEQRLGAGVNFLVPDWPAPARVRAAMTTRQGGVSRGPFATLNLGRGGGDDTAAVDENRRRVFAALGVPAEPCWIRQVHGARVVRMPEEATEPEADASFTTRAGVVCVVQAADCLPVLLCDDSGSVVAAAHAGWRGLAAGVLQNTVRALPVPPARLMAWLGAAIGPGAFEVGPEVREAFLRGDRGAAAAFVPRGGEGSEIKYLADLYALARRALAAAGVERTYGGGRCTFGEAEAFFSYRRDRATGRMAALIWLEREGPIQGSGPIE